MDCYKFTNYEFYPQRNLLLKNEKQQSEEINLEPQLARLLVFFLEHPFEVLSRDKLMDSLWQGIVAESAVNQAVAKLRRILEDDASQPEFIETVSKQGYRFLIRAEYYVQTSEKGVATINKLTRSSNKLIVSLLFLIAVVLVFWLFSSWQSQSYKNPTPGELKPVTSLVGSEIAPNLHRQSQMLVYAHRQAADSGYDLMLQSRDGKLKNLTQSPDASEIRSAFSNRGDMLAWTRFQDSKCEIHLARWPHDLYANDLPIAGERLADCSMYDIQLAWSSDDQFLYFNRHAWEGGPLRLYRVRISDKLVSEISDAPDDQVGDVSFGLNRANNRLLLARTQHWNASQLMSRQVDDNSGNRSWLSHERMPFWIKDLEALEGTEYWLYSQAPDYQNIMTYDLTRNRSQLLLNSDDFVSDLTFDPQQGQLLFSRYQFDNDLVRISNPAGNSSNDNELPAPEILVSSSRRNWFPVMDETKQLLYFFSDRTGQTQIWRYSFSSQSVQILTSFSQGYRPWRMSLSPDGTRILFDGSDNRLYVLTPESGEIEELTSDKQPDYNPQWRDDQRINFVRKDGDSWSMMNMQLNTGEISPLNLPGAFSAKLTDEINDDGYYSHLNLPGFWQYQAGKSTRISDKGSPGPFNQWQLGKRGVYYLASFRGRAAIWYFDFERDQHKPLYSFAIRDFASYQVSQDERFIIVTKARNISADIWSVNIL